MTFPLKKDDRVEDRRVKKIWPKPGDQERYEGIFGTVVEATEEGFRVRWEEGYTMGYAWSFLEEGIVKAS